MKLKKFNFLSQHRTERPTIAPTTKITKYTIKEKVPQDDNIQEIYKREFTTPIYLKRSSLHIPGSGKSYVVRRTTGGLGMRIVNSDDTFEKRLKDAGYSLDTRKMDELERDRIRGVAKKPLRDYNRTTLMVGWTYH